MIEFEFLPGSTILGNKRELIGAEFVSAARGLSRGQSTWEALEFFAEEENWSLLPKSRLGLEFIIFPDAPVKGVDQIRCLWHHRDNKSLWLPTALSLKKPFGHEHWVAVPRASEG